MTDLLTLLPNIYQTSPHLRSLLDRHTAAFDQSNITVVDLVSLDPRTICQRARISLNDVHRIVGGVRDALNADTMGTIVPRPGRVAAAGAPGVDSGKNMQALKQAQGLVGFGDDGIDGLLGGGVMTGSVTEIVGESGAGKTQLLLRLCFSIQQVPHKRSAIYICTESQISTRRMVGMLQQLREQEVPGWETLSLDRIHTAMCQYLETLEHIVRYQLPIAVERHDIGLVIVDSIAANFRVDDDHDNEVDAAATATATNSRTRKVGRLTKRAGQVVRLGTLLKEMAARMNVAIVVSNQVSDWFEPAYSYRHGQRQQQSGYGQHGYVAGVGVGIGIGVGEGRSSAFSTQASQDVAMSQYSMPSDAMIMTYDYQAKWFTGWGDMDTEDGMVDESLAAAAGQMKTPMLGMAWTNILDARIALVKGSFTHVVSTDADAVENGGAGGEGEGALWKERTRRWMRVVFAPWAEAAVPLEYEIWEGGVRSLV